MSTRLVFTCRAEHRLRSTGELKSSTLTVIVIEESKHETHKKSILTTTKLKGYVNANTMTVCVNAYIMTMITVCEMQVNKTKLI